MRSLRLQVVALGLCVGIGSVADATVYEVNAGAACPGSGTPAAPFCSIGQGAAVAVAGRHRERGAGRLPRAGDAAGVGRSRPAHPLPRERGGRAGARHRQPLRPGLWSPATATAWSTPFDPDTNTRQVFVDGVQLAEEPTLLPRRRARSSTTRGAAVLYVDIGGANPAPRT